MPLLKGNLHTHTTFSDGRLPIDEVIARYRELGYDFLAITDHDDRIHEDYWFQIPAGDDRMLVLPGVEIDYRPLGQHVGKVTGDQRDALHPEPSRPLRPDRGADPPPDPHDHARRPAHPRGGDHRHRRVPARVRRGGHPRSPRSPPTTAIATRTSGGRGSRSRRRGTPTPSCAPSRRGTSWSGSPARRGATEPRRSCGAGAGSARAPPPSSGPAARCRATGSPPR